MLVIVERHGLTAGNVVLSNEVLEVSHTLPLVSLNFLINYNLI